MARIIRTDRAKADVLEIARYIASQNTSAAERWVDELDRILHLIAAQTQMGERVDQLSVGVRRRSMGQYNLFYAEIDGGIELRPVLHGARKIEDLL
jgi:toxin ParE1/3/4